MPEVIMRMSSAQDEQHAGTHLILHHALADKWGAAVAGQQECNAGGDDADEVERMVGGKATVEVGGEGQRMEARVALGLRQAHIEGQIQTLEELITFL
eukprot:677841-Pelagomonas_calceolata.AAC.4